MSKHRAKEGVFTVESLVSELQSLGTWATSAKKISDCYWRVPCFGTISLGMASGRAPEPPGHIELSCQGQDIILNKYSPCSKHDWGISGHAVVVEILKLRRWALGNQLASFNYLTIFITLQLARQLLIVNQMPDDCKSACAEERNRCSRNAFLVLHASAQM